MRHISIMIPELKESPDAVVGLLETLHDEYLILCPVWHFFREVDLLYLRVSEHIARPIMDYLDKNEYEYNEEVYEENVEITKKYGNFFIPLFHAYSLFALHYKDDDLLYVFERVVHCFINITTRDSWKNKNFTQPSLLANLLEANLGIQLDKEIERKRPIYGALEEERKKIISKRRSL